MKNWENKVSVFNRKIAGFFTHTENIHLAEFQTKHKERNILPRIECYVGEKTLATKIG